MPVGPCMCYIKLHFSLLEFRAVTALQAVGFLHLGQRPFKEPLSPLSTAAAWIKFFMFTSVRFYFRVHSPGSWDAFGDAEAMGMRSDSMHPFPAADPPFYLGVVDRVTATCAHAFHDASGATAPWLPGHVFIISFAPCLHHCALCFRPCSEIFLH